MNVKGLLFLFLSLFLFSSSAFANVTGRVVDQSSSPVKNAMVTFTNLENRFIWVYSDDNGNFSIPGPWPVAVVSGGMRIDLSKDITVHGNTVAFYTNGKADVSIEIYNATGRKIETLNFQKPGEGYHYINPFAALARKLPKTVYLLKIKTGDKIAFVKMVHVGFAAAGTSLTAPGRGGQQPAARLGKITAVDQIRVGKTSYVAKIVPVNTYNDNVGDVQINGFDVNARVDSLFKLMVQSDIVAQLIQIDFREASSGDITASKLGSLFGGGGATPTVPTATAEDIPQNWVLEARRIQNAALATPLKIPIMLSLDCVHGLNPVIGGTVIPHNIALGATRDPALVERVLHITALEAKGIGLNWVLAPCVAVPRHDYWGRVFEGFGETPELARMMGKAAVMGLQGSDLSHPYTVAACTKHFAGDGGTFNGVDRGNTVGVDSVLKKIHCQGYIGAIEAGTATIMASFSKWNGLEMHRNKAMLTDYLKGTLGFDGFIEGDWGAHWGGSFGTSDCMNAGLDVPMALGKGHISSMAMDFNGMYPAGKPRVEDACKRVLKIKCRMGLFDKSPMPDTALTPLVGSQLHRDVAREAVRKSLVLLKNDNSALPLSKTANVHLMGIHSHDMGLQCGGWTITWQGGMGAITKGTTIQQGFAKFCTGKLTQSDTTTNIPSDADVLVVVGGEGPYAEMQGDVGNNWADNPKWKPTEFNLKAFEKNLITAAKASGKKVVCVLICGRPIEITDDIAKCDAFVVAWYPGTEGDGVAEVLYNQNGYDFSGRLPATWPSSRTQEPINYGAMGDSTGSGGTPLFPYGYGRNFAGELPTAFP
jgi:beta-glucosidase